MRRNERKMNKKKTQFVHFVDTYFLGVRIDGEIGKPYAK